MTKQTNFFHKLGSPYTYNLQTTNSLTIATTGGEQTDSVQRSEVCMQQTEECQFIRMQTPCKDRFVVTPQMKTLSNKGCWAFKVSCSRLIIVNKLIIKLECLFQINTLVKMRTTDS